MPSNIAFYIHHHGNGHFMRCLAIAKSFDKHNIYFLGSNLERFKDSIPAHIVCVDLKIDVLSEGETATIGVGELTGLHYAPLDILGQRDRVLQLTRFFCDTPQLLLVIDVSVEVAMLAQLCGVPFLYVRQHGLRNDLPHEIAYRNAQSLIAPYHYKMESSLEEWLKRKIFYSGCFSRFEFENISFDDKVAKKNVLVMTGAGGTCIDMHFLKYLGKSCPEWEFKIVGLSEVGSEDNLHFIGLLSNPYVQIKSADVVIGNCGHNTVMEVATFNKPFITIPEDRPFSEQFEKAAILEKLRLAKIVYPENRYKVNWQALLDCTGKCMPQWVEYNTPKAIINISEHINSIYASLYPNSN